MLDAFSNVNCNLMDMGPGMHTEIQDSDEDWKTCVGGGLKGEDFAGKDLRVGPLVDGNIHAFRVCS